MTQEEVLSPRGHVGVTLPRDLPAQQMVAYARQAEELGFDQIWVVEDLGRRGGIAQAASVLAATTGITVGIGILPAGARNVCFTGMELATLAQLHPGRLIAGIGHGMPHARLDVPGRLLARQPPDADQGVHRRAPPAPAGRARPRERPLHTLRRRRSHPPRPPTPQGRPSGRPRRPRPQITGSRGRDRRRAPPAEPAAPACITASLHHLGITVTPKRPEIVTYDAAAVDDEEEAALARVRPSLEAGRAWAAWSNCRSDVGSPPVNVVGALAALCRTGRRAVAPVSPTAGSGEGLRPGQTACVSCFSRLARTSSMWFCAHCLSTRAERCRERPRSVSS